MIPVFLSYVLSFIYLSIYWVNHHQLLLATEKISTSVLWANLHLLFWLSLIPFTTSWMGENHLEAVPVAFYGGILLMSALAFRVLELSLLKLHHSKARLSIALRGARKEKISLILYLFAIPMAFIHVYISIGCYILVAIVWVIPERKLNSYITES